MSLGGAGQGMRGCGCMLAIFPSPSLPNVLILHPLRMKTEGVVDPTPLRLKISNPLLLFLKGTWLCAVAEQRRELFVPSPGFTHACLGGQRLQLQPEKSMFNHKYPPEAWRRFQEPHKLLAKEALANGGHERTFGPVVASR